MNIRSTVAKLSIALLSMCVTTSCTAQEPEPPKYPGNVDGIRFLIPRDALLLPVRYEGEDDWSPPLMPRNERTFADRLSMAELQNFDISGLASYSDPVGTKHFNEEPPWGPISVTFRFFDRGANLSTIGKSYFPDLLTNPHNQPDQWDLKLRQSDRKSPNYNASFDRNYASKDGLIWIMCDNRRMVVEPFAKLPDNCFLRGIDLDSRAEIQVHLPARLMKSWKEIYHRASDILASWRVQKSTF